MLISCFQLQFSCSFWPSPPSTPWCHILHLNSLDYISLRPFPFSINFYFFSPSTNTRSYVAYIIYIGLSQFQFWCSSPAKQISGVLRHNLDLPSHYLKKYFFSVFCISRWVPGDSSPFKSSHRFALLDQWPTNSIISNLWSTTHCARVLVIDEQFAWSKLLGNSSTETAVTVIARKHCSWTCRTCRAGACPVI